MKNLLKRKRTVISLGSALAISCMALTALVVQPEPANAAVPTTCNSNGVSQSVHLTGKKHANGSAEILVKFKNGQSCLLPAVWKQVSAMILRIAERDFYAGETIDDPSDPHIYYVEHDVKEGDLITYTPCRNCMS